MGLIIPRSQVQVLSPLPSPLPRYRLSGQGLLIGVYLKDPDQVRPVADSSGGPGHAHQIDIKLNILRR